jgi:hypothetical protein
MTPEKRRELLRLASDYASEQVTPRMRNGARLELHEDDLAVLALLDERAGDVRRGAATALDSLSDPNATWETHFRRLASSVQWLADYQLQLHELLRDGLEEPHLEPEDDEEPQARRAVASGRPPLG